MVQILGIYDPKVRVSFDVDETLIKLNSEGEIIVHEKHVQALKNHYARGHHVRVHTGLGKEWAQYIVSFLGLDMYVHEAVAKDRWVYDDLEPNEWLERIYLYKEGFNNGQSAGAYEKDDRSVKNGSNVHSTTGRGSNLLYPIPQIQSVGFEITKYSNQG